MPDDLPAELVGKGKRVGGVFMFLIGASIVLDTHVAWVGLPIVVLGAALFGWGLAEGRDTTALPSTAPDATTESQP